MLESVRNFLAEHYLQLKFVHLLAVMVWVWSTSVAYAFYLVPVFKAWRRSSGDVEVIRLRNWVIERFDQGVIYEHIAFPVILITGPLLFWSGGFNSGVGWLMRKYGLSCDNLLSVDIVTADGRFLTASERENADLFWAVRGGGLVGVVTSFESRLHPVSSILGG